MFNEVFKKNIKSAIYQTQKQKNNPQIKFTHVTFHKCLWTETSTVQKRIKKKLNESKKNSKPLKLSVIFLHIFPMFEKKIKTPNEACNTHP